MASTEIIIKPKQKWHLLDTNELWRFRELFYIFTWRDLKVRYKQTIVGIGWVVFQPIVTMIIFTVFFGRLAKVPTGSLPYELFVYIGLIFWTFFSSSISSASNTFIENSNILKKVYFPKEILVISTIITNLVDLAINFFLLIVVALTLKFIPSMAIFYITPLMILISILAASGIGLFLSSLNIKFRDVRYILPFFIQILLFLTPIIYPSSSVRDSFRYLIALNPMTAVVESMRAVFSGSNQFDVPVIIISLLSSIFFFVIGLLFFRSTERYFADLA